MAQTATQNLATHLLGRPVTDWIAEQRTDGRSFQAIAFRLHSEIGLYVSDETIRRWVSAVA